MAITGILFSKKNSVIGVKDTLSSIGLLKGVLPPSVGGIGGIVVDATIGELHKSSCKVTENPVEEGAKVNDHVQMENAHLEIEGVISDTPIGFSLIGFGATLNTQIATGIGLAGAVAGNFLGAGASLSIQAFNQLVDLQNTRQPFTVITGLKRYTNMIMEDLEVPRTAQTGNAIHFKAVLKQVRIVKSQTSFSSIASGAKKLASKTKNLGQKVSDAVKEGSSLKKEGSKDQSLLNELLGK